MKYKVGDKVKIRADLKPGADYGGLVPMLSMCSKRGNVVTIKNSEVCDGLLLYHIEGDECDFLWTEEMFEEIADKEKAGTAMKYKIGDKVKIREDLRFTYNWNDTGINITDDMARKAGKTATIKNIYPINRYTIEEDGGCRTWHEDMFEDVVEEQKTTKYKVGDKVKLRADLHEDENWCGALVDVTKGMLKWAGKVVTISKVRDNNSYGIREDGGTYLWHESMIQGKAIPVRIGVSEGKVDIKTEGTSQKEVAEMLGCEPKEVPKDAANDPVSHPSHYTDGKIEVIDYIEDKKLGYHLGNACKYISRCQLKYGGKKRIEDLRKAIWYIQRQIEVWEKDDKQKTKQGY